MNSYNTNIFPPLSKKVISMGMTYLCCCCCNGGKPSICRPHGLNCQPGGMMMHASMDVYIYNISIHGWANNGFRTTSCLPSVFHHAIPAQVPI